MLKTEQSFHHIGVACRDIKVMKAFVESIESIVSDSGIVHDSLQQIDLCLLETKDGIRYELIAGKAVEGVLAAGASYYHVCYEVPDIKAAIQEMKGKNCILVKGPIPAKLFNGRQIAFIMTPMGLVEYLEAERH